MKLYWNEFTSILYRKAEFKSIVLLDWKKGFTFRSNLLDPYMTNELINDDVKDIPALARRFPTSKPFKPLFKMMSLVTLFKADKDDVIKVDSNILEGHGEIEAIPIAAPKTVLLTIILQSQVSFIA